jgi:hypothetical protein
MPKNCLEGMQADKVAPHAFIDSNEPDKSESNLTGIKPNRSHLSLVGHSDQGDSSRLLHTNQLSEEVWWEELMQSCLETRQHSMKKWCKSDRFWPRARVKRVDETGQIEKSLTWTSGSPRQLSAGPMGYRRRGLSTYSRCLETYGDMQVCKRRKYSIFSLSRVSHLFCDSKIQNDLSAPTSGFGFHRKESCIDISHGHNRNEAAQKRKYIGQKLKKLFQKKVE